MARDKKMTWKRRVFLVSRSYLGGGELNEWVLERAVGMRRE